MSLVTLGLLGVGPFKSLKPRGPPPPWWVALLAALGFGGFVALLVLWR